MQRFLDCLLPIAQVGGLLLDGPYLTQAVTRLDRVEVQVVERCAWEICIWVLMTGGVGTCDLTPLMEGLAFLPVAVCLVPTCQRAGSW